MRLPQYPNALTFQSWRRDIKTATISSCENPERASVFIFPVGSEDASFDSLSVSDSDKHRALDAKLADALLKIVTCRIQNPDIPRAGRVGAPGGAAVRGRTRLD